MKKKSNIKFKYNSIVMTIITFCMISLPVFAGTKKTININHDGIARQYILYIPSSYTGNTPVPLVIDMHGYYGNMNMQYTGDSGIRWRAKADKAGFICAFPNGYWWSWNGGSCCGDAVEDNIDDVGFLKAVVDNIKRSYNIACNKVYASGYSNGGGMAMRLAVEASDTFAAVIGYVADPDVALNLARPISVIFFRGYNDNEVPYNGDADDKSAQESFQAWAAANSCTGTPVEVYRNNTNVCMIYNNCAGGVKVELCSINSDHLNMINNPDNVPVIDMGWDFVKNFTEPNGGTCGEPDNGGGGGGCGSPLSAVITQPIANGGLIALLTLIIGLCSVGIYRRNKK
jgi:poly(3-hydroxybutyrate) depolymerase